MSQTILRGYKTSITNLNDLEKLLRELRAKLREKITEECRYLLAKEIQTMFDDIALDKITRPESINQVARNNLLNRINRASFRQLPIDYNFNISVNIILNEDFTFLKVNCNNFIYDDVFKLFTELDEYSISDTDIMYSNDTKAKRWKNLVKEYEDFSPMGVTLIKGTENFLEDIKLEELVFDTPEERLEILTRREMTIRLLNMYSSSEQDGAIPPLKLAGYIDDALFRLENSEVLEQMSEIKSSIKKSLVPITIELIS